MPVLPVNTEMTVADYSILLSAWVLNDCLFLPHSEHEHAHMRSIPKQLKVTNIHYRWCCHKTNSLMINSKPCCIKTQL